MRNVRLVALAGIASVLSGCGGGGGGGGQSSAPTVLEAEVTVQAQSGGSPLQAQSSGFLHYQWRSTDGTIVDQDSPSTTWTLPNGPGFHSAYVLVSNGLGGYTEGRVVVNTDTTGLALTTPAAVPLAAPPSAASSAAGPFRLFSADDHSPPPAGGVYLPDSSFVLSTFGILSPTSEVAPSDLRGEVVFPNIVPGPASNVNLNCALGLGAPLVSCGTLSALWPSAVTLPTASALTAYLDTDIYELGQPAHAGRVFLADGSPCGTVDEFFGVQATATVSVLDVRGNVLYGPARLDAFGGYSLPSVANGVTAQFQCENGSVLSVAVSLLTRTILLSNPAPPAITSMTVTSKSQMSAIPAGSPIGVVTTPQTGLPSDRVLRSDRFLTGKGIDTRVSACQYYRAVGAVQACDASGNFSGAVAFTDWKRTVLIDSFALPNTPIFRATFVNQTSVNLARVHASVSYSASQTAAYVCNYPGPSSLSPSQSEIDAAITAAVAGNNLTACFAMDYTATPGVNGGKPYTRFLIFGPSGALLPSVNLDTRGEKFVPGVCVACHGGDHFAGKYPEDGFGRVDIGGHFLPYDTGNFEFSSQAGLTEAVQELAIFNLNQNVLNAGPNAAISTLIAGWYPNGSTVLNKNYVDPSWQVQNAGAVSFYQQVNARSCRSCHIALTEPYNIENYPMGGTVNLFLSSAANDFAATLCNVSSSPRRTHSMPNSMVTYNLFWLSAGSSADQPSLTTQLIKALGPSFVFSSCTN